MKKWILLFFVCTGSWAQAQWNFRPQLGLGFTDNANYEDTDRDSDLFWWLRSSNTFVSGNSRWSLWLNYRSYTKQNQNNVLSYRLGDTMGMGNRSLGDLDWDLAFGGQQYTQDAPGTTETSFNNNYLETSILKNWHITSDLEMAIEPLYQLKVFSQLDGRTDHTFLLNTALDWKFALEQSLNPFAEIGFVSSNQSAYSKNYLEFGTDWHYSSQFDLSYILHFVSRYSSYPNRKVSDTTVVSNKRGALRNLSQSGIESQSLIQILGSVVKMVGKTEFKASTGLTSQTSRSGYENFSEVEVLASALVPL